MRVTDGGSLDELIAAIKRRDVGVVKILLARANGHEDVAAMLASWSGRGGRRP